MPGCSPKAWDEIKDIWYDFAKVDPVKGNFEGAKPGEPVDGGVLALPILEQMRTLCKNVTMMSMVTCNDVNHTTFYLKLGVWSL